MNHRCSIIATLINIFYAHALVFPWLPLLASQCPTRPHEHVDNDRVAEEHLGGLSQDLG
ncbi:hypothetical protein JAAARDRAFT_585231 [Jaapia argillacea MUCL 33604]|uniref:Uncharacterized protein n=1 Tax=Jaapia argillacea MUCL 33604 TaxID=933084 RepID=A0A067PJ39_9AGAM|nr:hypothetical protein JAAARDRAFT_585231 [Jaapia argillacea MUCL 33604]